MSDRNGWVEIGPGTTINVRLNLLTHDPRPGNRSYVQIGDNEWAMVIGWDDQHRRSILGETFFVIDAIDIDSGLRMIHERKKAD